MTSPALLAPWSVEAGAVCDALGTDPARGLGAREVAARRLAHGENRLRRIEARGAGAILLAQLRSAVVLLLAIGSAVAFAFGQPTEGVAIAAVVVLNTLLGFVTELRAVRSMEALRALGEVTATVRRDGVLARVRATELVPGDVVLVEAGDVITADLRLIDASALAADESALTGESVPVDKSARPVAADASLADRRSMLFKGTTITHGAGDAVVVGTGMHTELGRISALVAEAEDQTTPLERRIETLGRQLMLVSLGFVALATGLGLARGEELFLMIESAIALAVATVPEGLPVVTTIALARGMWRLAARKVLIEKLGAVETLGSTSLILTDKTGTLTENRMRAVELVLEEGSLRLDEGPLDSHAAALALRIGAQASEAVAGEAAVGDPLEVALVEAAARHGVSRAALLAEEPELRELAFDPVRKMSATLHQRAGGVRLAVKGAPEAVLACSTRVATRAGVAPLDAAARARWEEANLACAARGLRVIALALRDLEAPREPLYEALTFVGLIGLADPPRTRVREALEAARAAGVRVVMATGDQAPTASSVAAAVGLAAGEAAQTIEGAAVPHAPQDEDASARARAADVVARASPEEKLRLLRLHQRAGAVVAMLGDGVNDAPALRQADIGVAMGKRGTQVARQAADMVLEDDELGSVVAAIAEGRVIFDNLRAFVVYLLGCNLAEILVIGAASAVGWPLPILPLPILFLNLLTDVFPAAALGVGEGDPRVMERAPRDPAEPFLTRRHWSSIVGHAALLTGAVLAAYGAALDAHGLAVARTVAFATLGFGQLWHVLSMADWRASPFFNEVTQNPWVGAALALCVPLLSAGLLAPGLRDLLGAVPMPAGAWGLALGASAAPFALVQLGRLARRLVTGGHEAP
ncbi:MAG: cation-transporting P-type ATPase [Sandaracinaceae bacterium]|nr:cation-transporting P-type ATPase [Sandaracinaceae bacterium]